ncbi:MAG: cell division protein FtsZ [Thermoplasmatota archaeon]
MARRGYITFGMGAASTRGTLRPAVRVMGVGGAGCNIVDSMLDHMDAGLRHVELIAVNTDARSLYGLRCRRVLIGKDITHGRGASSLPAIGEEAVKADMPKVMEALRGTDVLFLICGLGGGTGTGASPVIAGLAREAGALVVALAVKPFRAEGSTRNHLARLGLERLREAADAVVALENDRLVREHPALGFQEALGRADRVLLTPVKSIAQLLTRDDLPNLRRVLGIRDLAHLCFGEGSIELGERSAASAALGSLAAETDLRAHDRAVVVLYCPPGSSDDELHRIVQELHHFIHDDAEIMWGPIVDPSLSRNVRLLAVVGRMRGGGSGPGPDAPP